MEGQRDPEGNPEITRVIASVRQAPTEVTRVEPVRAVRTPAPPGQRAAVGAASFQVVGVTLPPQ